MKRKSFYRILGPPFGKNFMDFDVQRLLPPLVTRLTRAVGVQLVVPWLCVPAFRTGLPLAKGVLIAQNRLFKRPFP